MPDEPRDRDAEDVQLRARVDALEEENESLRADIKRLEEKFGKLDNRLGVVEARNGVR